MAMSRKDIERMLELAESGKEPAEFQALKVRYYGEGQDLQKLKPVIEKMNREKAKAHGGLVEGQE